MNEFDANTITLRTLNASSAPAALPIAGVVTLGLAGSVFALRRKR